MNDKLDDLNMNHDVYLVDLYRAAAEIEDMSIRDFLLKYKLASVKEKKK